MSTKGQSAIAPGMSDRDAIAALTADHRRVKSLFKEFEKAKETGHRKEQSQKAALVEQICTELKIHAEIEEEIFYPAVRKQIDDSDLMDEALVEHAGAKDLIAQLEAMDPAEDLYDAKVTVLGEQIDHHVKEEEGEMFPRATKAKVDTARLGAQMEKRRAELKAELGVADDDKREDDGESDERNEEEDNAESSSKKRRA
jgi:hemerythrin-like domain-containing protein